MLNLITHDDPQWQRRYQSHGRENGAATYSREIVRFQIPVWEAELGDAATATISTCPLVYGEPGNRRRPLPGGDLLVQYLHEWRFQRPQKAAVALHSALRASYGRVAFVVAYRGLQAILEAEGLTALYVPMSIDTQQVKAYRLPDDAPRDDRAIAYYGNVGRFKAEHYRELTKTVPAFGLDFHHIRERQPLSWGRLAHYAYGAGVGRCAMEMAALGLRVLISGRSYGGLVMGHGDYLTQQSTNFNGRLVTGPRTLRGGLELLPESQLWTPMDSRESVEWLRTEIWEKIHGRRLPRAPR